MIQERGENGRKCELRCSAAKRGLAREHAEQADILPDLLWQDVRNRQTERDL